MKTIVYECPTPLHPNQRFMAFLVQDAWETVKGKRTGIMIPDILPVRFMADTADGATARALAFWNDERAKEAAKIENVQKAIAARKKTA